MLREQGQEWRRVFIRHSLSFILSCFKCNLTMGLFVLRLLTPWRLMILLCLSVTLLDPRFFKDGKF